MHDDARTTNLLGALALALSDAQDAAARRTSGLGSSACAALVTLGVQPGITIGRLAEVLGLTHSVAVRLAEGLAAADLVARDRGPDRRQVALRLTAAGESRRGAILAARADALGTALAALAPDERARLAELTGRLLARLTGSRRTADHICRLCDEDACPGDACPVEREAVRLDAETSP